jgi:hypothetical protein
MSASLPAESPRSVRTKSVVFAVIVAMMAYVVFHNENEYVLLDPAHPA